MKFILDLISKAVKVQQVAYNNGHENQGASIDVVAEIYKTCTHNKYRGNREAGDLLMQIHNSDFEDSLKYAKPLCFKAKSIIRSELELRFKR